jgi:prepilin-type N-terminal cleavage/methylation domain-containing protein
MYESHLLRPSAVVLLTLRVRPSRRHNLTRSVRSTFRNATLVDSPVLNGFSNPQSPIPRPSSTAPRGFTLIEALAAIAIAAIAGSVLLLGTTSSIQSTDDAMRRTIAYGMAQQLMDEVVGCRYMDLGGSPYDTTLKPSAAEAATGNRSLFDDMGDFNGVRSQPPKDFYGIALGTDNGQGEQRNPAFQCSSGFLQNWRQEIDVCYVSDTNLTAALPAGQTSDYRAVEVRIIYNDPKSGPLPLAKIRRVVTYVAPLQVN